MKVFVINKHGFPLMPTKPRKARLLLKEGKAKIFKRIPFTIQLVSGSSGYKQEVKAGLDSGYQNIGFCAITDKEELLSGEVILMQGMSERLTERSKYRRQRRNRKRYHKPRFDNRKKEKGWLAPSIQHKLDTHCKVIEMVNSVLPVTHWTIEVADFDIQKIKNPEIQGKEYQLGVQYGFDHLRQYILHRDNHKCQNPDCKNKSKQPILQVHHIGFWKQDRTDRPGNLITLCNKCHSTKNHNQSGFLYGWEPKTKSFKPETFMSTVTARLAQIANSITWGCITKIDRKELGIDKTHYNDAFVIAGGRNQVRCTPNKLEQIRRHKRSMEQFYDAKYWDTRDVSKKEKVKPGIKLCSGRRTRNKNQNGENLRKYRGHKIKKGRRAIKTKRYPYSQGDLVRFEGRVFEVIGMQNKGKGVKIANYPGVKNKVVNPDQVESVQKREGICYVA